MSASCRTISLFEIVRGEYLSNTQWAAILSILQMEIYGEPYVRRIHTYIYIYIYKLGRCLRHRGGEPSLSELKVPMACSYLRWTV